MADRHLRRFGSYDEDQNLLVGASGPLPMVLASENPPAEPLPRQSLRFSNYDADGNLLVAVDPINPIPVLLVDENGDVLPVFGEGGAQNLNQLTDVAIATPTSGQVLTFNGTAWVNGAGGAGSGGATTLDQLSDVIITSVQVGNVLRHNGTAFVNAPLVAGDIPTGIAATKIGNGTVNDAEFATLDGVTSGIQLQLNNKAATIHTHTIANVTALQAALDGKAALAHTHTASQISDFTAVAQGIVGAMAQAGGGSYTPNPTPAISFPTGQNVMGTAPPTTGTHTQGDYIENSAPTVLGTTGDRYVILGWKCITSGTPGIWVPLQAPTSYEPESGESGGGTTPTTGFTSNGTRYDWDLPATTQGWLKEYSTPSSIGVALTRELDGSAGVLRGVVTGMTAGVYNDVVVWDNQQKAHGTIAGGALRVKCKLVAGSGVITARIYWKDNVTFTMHFGQATQLTVGSYVDLIYNATDITPGASNVYSYGVEFVTESAAGTGFEFMLDDYQQGIWTVAGSNNPPPPGGTASGIERLIVYNGKIARPDGTPFVLKGVNSDKIAYGYVHSDWTTGSANNIHSVLVPAAKAAGMNCWLFGFSALGVLGSHTPHYASQPVPQSVYLAMLDDLVLRCKNNAMYLVLVARNHEIDDPGASYGGLNQPGRPDAQMEQALVALAARYKNEPHVMYGSQVEPHDYSWAQLRPQWQSIHDQIHAATAPHQPIVMHSGPAWGRDLRDAPNDPINRTNAVYKFHVYSSAISGGWSQSQTYFQPAIDAGLPTFCGEYGDEDHANLTPILEANQIGRTPWQWSDEGNPWMLATWNPVTYNTWGNTYVSHVAANPASTVTVNP